MKLCFNTLLQRVLMGRLDAGRLTRMRLTLVKYDGTFDHRTNVSVREFQHADVRGERYFSTMFGSDFRWHLDPHAGSLTVEHIEVSPLMVTIYCNSRDPIEHPVPSGKPAHGARITR